MKSRIPVLAVWSVALLGLLAVVARAATPVETAATTGPGGTSPLYKVELIIFRYAASGGSEDFNAPAEGRGFGGKLDAGGAPPSVIHMLDSGELQMGAEAAALRANAGLQVLAHAGWVQTATVWPRHTGLPIEQLGINVAGLSGNLYLERGDLLHFGANLRLGSNPSYTLSELRKLRFSEKHYLDNPAFGLIVLVSPGR
jgi:hypothetical protein